MTKRNIFIGILTIVVVAYAVKTSQQRAPTTELDVAALYPGLVDQLNDVRAVSIESAKDKTVLENNGETWVVANRDGFPAKFADVKNALLNLSNATIIEKKTSKPERYAQIGVAEIDKEGSEAVQITLEGAADATLASLLIGEERAGSQVNARQFYVRKADSDTALLVEGELRLAAAAKEWMDTAVVNVPTERVRSVAISRPGDPIVSVVKEKPSDNFFTLEGVPAGHVAKSRAAVSSLGAVLLDIRFEDVAAAAKTQGLSASAAAEVQTFDGLIANLQRFEMDGKPYVQFRFDYDPQAVFKDEIEDDDAEHDANDNDSAEKADTQDATLSVADEVTTLNEKVANWVYALPDYKSRMLDKTFAEMIKPEEEATEKKAE